MTPNGGEMRHRVLEASAGTGKTYQIIRHALDLLIERGIPIERLAVVTFSERAAGELRKRLRENLTSCDPSDEMRAGRRRAALIGLDRSMVTTIHGLCFTLLREYAFEAGEPLVQDVTSGDDIFPVMYDRYIRGELRRFIMQDTAWEEIAGSIAENGFFLDLAAGASRFYQPRTCSIHPDPARPFDPRPLCEEIIAELSHVGPGKKSTVTREKILETRAALKSHLSGGATGEALLNALIGDAAWKAVYNSGDLKVGSYATSLLNEECPSGNRAVALLQRLALELKTTHYYIPARIIKDSVRFSRLLMRHEGKIDYPGMLGRTLEAIERSPALAEMLRSRFIAALVDEFQDTDPIQWRIFDLLFAGRPDRHLFVVGDPKQAIYGFRGADVETFQGAVRRLTDELGAARESLSENYRSAPLLVNAIDRLFHESGIVGGYERITPSSGRGLEIAGKPDSRPLQIVCTSAEAGSRARDDFIAFVVGEIQLLLKGRCSFCDRNATRPLRADDIAILVRGGTDEKKIKAALSEAGIPFVTSRHDRLLDTVEAGEIALVLDAVADPSNQAAVKKALLTRFFRFPVERLEGFAGLSATEPLAVKLRAWGKLTTEGNWPAFFRSLYDETGRLSEAATSDDDPDASVTTLLDLGRELALIADRERFDAAGLRRCIVAEQTHRTSDDKPGMLLRVESDQPKVQIMTIHAAKGLEFPVAFVLGWFTQFGSNTFHRYHVENPDEENRRSWRIDLTGSEEAAYFHGLEAQAEESRLFYVALTRAVGRVYVPFSMSGKLPPRAGPLFTYLRNGMERAFPSLAARDAATPSSSIEYDGIYIRRLDEKDHAPDDTDTAPVLAVAVGPREAGSQDQLLQPPPAKAQILKHLFVPVNSFSSLASRNVAAEPAEEERMIETVSLEDDRETTSSALEYLPCEEPADEPLQEPEKPEAALPAGARTGTLFHAAMELLDYEAVLAAKSPDDLTADGSATREVLDRLFRRYPIRRQPDPADVSRLADLAWKTLRTPLPFLGGEPLGACRERRHEVTFWMPAPGTEDRELLGTKISGGLLTGAIDLFLRYKNKYYILDFKTNRSPDGYGSSLLGSIMEEHRYHLQYRLYAVALRRLLRGMNTRPGTTPIAGAGYLFVRGMNGRSGSPGIFFAGLSDNVLDEFEKKALPALLVPKPDREASA